MKHLFIFLLLICGMQLGAQQPNQAEITWESTSKNLGKIKQGQAQSILYEFTNTGNGPLIIASVAPSCGCTTEDFSKQSIAPGKKGYVKLTYNAAVPGNFTKSATVNTNTTQGQYILYFNGEVISE